MKVQKIYADVVDKYWDMVIRPTVSQTVPGAEASMLKALLVGQAECWIGYDLNEDKSRRVKALAITSIMNDRILLTRNLIVYHLYAFENINMADWLEAINVLKEYAKSRRCTGLVAYSDNPRVAQMFKQAGGDTSYRFLRVEI